MGSILETIKSQTAECHARIEGLIPVFSPSFTLADYRRVLQAFYGYYSGLEPALAVTPGLDTALPDWRERSKLPWLEQDLAWLGSGKEALAALPLCSDLPVTGTLPRAFGALYVAEGSTLGGQIICRYLAHAQRVYPGKGATFFSGYGDRTGVKWKTFTQALCTFANPENESLIIQSAIETFETMSLWLSHRVQPGVQKSSATTGSL